MLQPCLRQSLSNVHRYSITLSCLPAHLVVLSHIASEIANPPSTHLHNHAEANTLRPRSLAGLSRSLCQHQSAMVLQSQPQNSQSHHNNAEAQRSLPFSNSTRKRCRSLQLSSSVHHPRHPSQSKCDTIGAFIYIRPLCAAWASLLANC